MTTLEIPDAQLLRRPPPTGGDRAGDVQRPEQVRLHLGLEVRRDDLLEEPGEEVAGAWTAASALSESAMSSRAVSRSSDAPTAVATRSGVATGRDDRLSGCERRLGDVDAHAAAGAGNQENFAARTVARVGSHALLSWHPAGADRSIRWFFRTNGTFFAWYANLEAPVVRWRDAGPTELAEPAGLAELAGSAGLDTLDRDLDVWIAPRVRQAGPDVVALVEAGAFPFDGTWCDFRPDPQWPTIGRNSRPVRLAQCYMYLAGYVTSQVQ